MVRYQTSPFFSAGLSDKSKNFSREARIASDKSQICRSGGGGERGAAGERRDCREFQGAAARKKTILGIRLGSGAGNNAKRILRPAVLSSEKPDWRFAEGSASQYRLFSSEQPRKDTQPGPADAFGVRRDRVLKARRRVTGAGCRSCCRRRLG